MERWPPATRGCRTSSRAPAARRPHTAEFCNDQSAPNPPRANEASPFLPFAQGNFRTASGKAELYSEAMKALGLDPVAEWMLLQNHQRNRQREISSGTCCPRSDNFLNSTFSNLPFIQQMEDTDLLEINSADARAREIVDGCTVKVYNHRGEIFLKARVDGAVQPGVVSARLNWAKSSPAFAI